jgi:hypothetical protein
MAAPPTPLSEAEVLDDLLGQVQWLSLVISTTREMEKGVSWFQASPSKKLARPYLKEEARHGCSPNYTDMEARG